METSDYETGLSKVAEEVLDEIPGTGCDAWWIPPNVREELEDAGLIATWRDRDGYLMVRVI
jgi:hypothetical protein